MTTTKFKTIQDWHNRVSTIYFGMVGAPLLFFLFIYMNITKRGDTTPLLNQNLVSILSYQIPVVTIIASFVGFYYYYSNLKLTRQKETLREKLDELRKILFIKFYFLLASNALSVFALYITKDLIHAGLYVLLLVAYTVTNPSINKIARDLRLGGVQKEIFFLRGSFNLEDMNDSLKTKDND